MSMFVCRQLIIVCSIFRLLWPQLMFYPWQTVCELFASADTNLSKRRIWYSKCISNINMTVPHKLGDRRRKQSPIFPSSDVAVYVYHTWVTYSRMQFTLRTNEEALCVYKRKRKCKIYSPSNGAQHPGLLSAWCTLLCAHCTVLPSPRAPFDVVSSSSSWLAREGGRVGKQDKWHICVTAGVSYGTVTSATVI